MIKKISFGSLALLLGTVFLTPLVGQAQTHNCDTMPNNSYKKLLKCVTVEGVREHQKAFQDIADRNGGVRSSGTPGYDDSVDYVADKMEAAGYDVTKQAFDFVSFATLGPSTLEKTSSSPIDVYVEDTDYNLLSQTEPGDVTAMVTAVDLDLGVGNASTSGCEAADFTGFPAGHIALIQRGACSFEDKAENADAAGAVGAIIFNQGNEPDREDLINATLGATYEGSIPVMFATYALGLEFNNNILAFGGLELHMIADVSRETVTTFNVIAESKFGNKQNVVMVGAHLDSVEEGPGVQDNGSGSGAILEVAEQLANNRPRNRLRFAWWGAEESGLVGSDFYVFSLTENELSKIALYLNFDMVGSPNYARFIYDGDGSAFGLEGPPGSGIIERTFERFYERRDKAHEPTEISFRSDYAAFFDNGIPFGGLFTGAEGIKTDDQVALYGGTAGEQYDPCYHLACDTFDNISLEVLDLNADAIAAATYRFSKSKTAIDRIRAAGATQNGAAAAAASVSNAYIVEMRGHHYIR